MHTFHFTLETQPELCPLPCEPCRIDLEVTGEEITLYDLAEIFIEAVEFEFDHAFGFYSNLESPFGENEEKYTLFSDLGEPEDTEPGVKETLVENVFTSGKQLAFLFDYGDEWHFLITCREVGEPKHDGESWGIQEIEGDLPVQYGDIEELEDLDEEIED